LKELPKTGKKLSELLFTRSKETSNTSGHHQANSTEPTAITFKIILMPT